MTEVFYISGAVAILATLMVITELHAIHALLYLVVSLLAVAMVFLSLGAPFIAVLEVIIYAGAIVVLFLFVVMMLNLGRATLEQERRWLGPLMWVGPTILLFVLLAELAYLLTVAESPPIVPMLVGPKEVGLTLFGPYLVGVEVASLLLLVGLVGAFHLGRRREEGDG
jgi:NADH-quinone oxidoreductase subunit J